MEEIVQQLKQKYGRVFLTYIGHHGFIWRELKRGEYRSIIAMAKNEHHLEELVCQAAVVYPDDIDFSVDFAGVPGALTPQILGTSCYMDSDQFLNYLTYNRHRTENSFETQAEIIIKSAFPSVSFAEMKEWSIFELTERLAQAEWKLRVIDKVTLDFTQIGEKKKEPVTADQQQEALQEEAHNLRERGIDPMMALAPQILWKRQITKIPFIAGTDWRNEAVWDVIREQIQEVPE